MNTATQASASQMAELLFASIRARMAARMRIISDVLRPCFHAFLLPFGAPGLVPPCILHRPFCMP